MQKKCKLAFFYREIGTKMTFEFYLIDTLTAEISDNLDTIFIDTLI